MNKLDKYGRNIFIKPMKKPESFWDAIPANMKPIEGHENFVADEGSFVTESVAIFNEADNDKYNAKLKRYLYAERIKNNKGTLDIYNSIKDSNPEIKRMYLKLSMYKKYNVFVDLSYYHALFLEKNVYKMDRAVNFYFDFLNRLINNPDIDAEYKKQTIFIPVDAGVWPMQPNSEVYDYKKNLNPISIIFRLVRTNPSGLKKAWGSKDIIFVGSRGYFKVDFSKFEMKNIPRFKTNLRKLMSTSEPVEDEYEIDELEADDSSDVNTDSKSAMAVKMIDTIEKKMDIKIDDVSAVEGEAKHEVLLDDKIGEHLVYSTDPLKFEKSAASQSNGVVIISITPDGPNDFDKLSGSVLNGVKGIDVYCMPK
jgi:acyl carrier protein